LATSKSTTFTRRSDIQKRNGITPSVCMNCMLELRRLQVDLVWCYKILFGIVDTPTEDFFVLSTYAQTRGHQYKLFKKPHVSPTRANFFSERVVNSWNSLPDGTDFSSLSRFKRCINKVDFSRFLKCF